MLKLVALASIAGAGALDYPESYYRPGFEQWAEKFKKQFATASEYRQRFLNWAAADDKIRSHNAKKSSYKLGHNQFSHLSLEEFHMDRKLGNFSTSRHGDKPAKQLRGSSVKKHVRQPGEKLADSVDWVAKGAVTAVKDQGQCGSCWSFSTTGAVEGAYQIKTGTLKSFSEQELVSCDKTDDGCQGGLMDQAFDWIAKKGGLCTEDSYPYAQSTYNGNAPACSQTCETVEGTDVTSHTDVDQSEDALMSALNQQPVAIAIEADQDDFMHYQSGVMTGACGKNLDHGVLVVGYGVYDGTPYWKVKNSWAASWGMEGYILIERGSDSCGILDSASYPTL